jgi:hypothetical protein
MSRIARTKWPVDSLAKLSRYILPTLGMLLAGGFLLSDALVSDAPREVPGEHGPLTVVYVGAEDCGPCRTWRRDQRPAFLDSGEFARLRYHEVIAPRLQHLLAEENWPPELAAVRDYTRARPGAPQWFLLRDSRILASGAGLSAWGGEIWPIIRRQVRHDPVVDDKSPAKAWLAAIRRKSDF